MFDLPSPGMHVNPCRPQHPPPLLLLQLPSTPGRFWYSPVSLPLLFLFLRLSPLPGGRGDELLKRSKKDLPLSSGFISSDGEEGREEGVSSSPPLPASSSSFPAFVIPLRGRYSKTRRIETRRGQNPRMKLLKCSSPLGGRKGASYCLLLPPRTHARTLV